MILVSIIIPAYNAARYIGRAIRSALAQTYRDIEVIVVDDGSTDKTADVVKSFGDPRIRYLHQENKFQGAARNYGIRESGGEYITFLDADDEYLPEKVERQVEFLQQQPEYAAVYCGAIHFYSKHPEQFYKKKGDFPHGDIFAALLRSSVINPNTVMIRKEVFRKVGGFNETRYWPEEWDLWLRMTRAGFRFGYIQEDLVKVEIREGSNTTMEIQPMLKAYVVGVLSDVISKMTEEEKRRYRAEEALRGWTFKLAVSYAIVGRKKEFFSAFIRSLAPLWRVPGFLPAATIFLIPTFFLRPLLIRLWEMYQLRSFYVVVPKT